MKNPGQARAHWLLSKLYESRTQSRTSLRLMEASTSPVITPLLHAADAWQEVALLLPVLVGLEIVLSADNAIATVREITLYGNSAKRTTLVPARTDAVRRPQHGRIRPNRLSQG